MRGTLEGELGKPWGADDHIGRYVLQRKLAQGGMAELFLASSDQLPEGSVVLKRIRPDFAGRGDFVRMFRREAALMIALDHPNIVRVFEVGQHGADAFIAMEHLQGRDVRGLVRAAQRAGVRLPPGFGVEICLRLLDGLEYAHTSVDSEGQPLGLVHRDVSPSNVFVTRDGSVKLLDFGIAKADAGTPTSNSPGPKGKGCYMAPEQCRASSLDHRADIFAVGAVLYELTTMRRAFAGPNDMAILLAILDGEVQPPTELDTGYPRALERVVLKALAYEPHDRFQSAREMRLALEKAAAAAELEPSQAQVVGTLVSLAKVEANAPVEASITGRSLAREENGGDDGNDRTGELRTRTDRGVLPPLRVRRTVTPPLEPEPAAKRRSLAPWLGAGAVAASLLLWAVWPSPPLAPPAAQPAKTAEDRRSPQASGDKARDMRLPSPLEEASRAQPRPPVPTPAAVAPVPKPRRQRKPAPPPAKPDESSPTVVARETTDASAPSSTPPVSGKLDDALRPPNL